MNLLSSSILVVLSEGEHVALRTTVGGCSCSLHERVGLFILLSHGLSVHTIHRLETNHRIASIMHPPGLKVQASLGSKSCQQCCVRCHHLCVHGSDMQVLIQRKEKQAKRRLETFKFQFPERQRRREGKKNKSRPRTQNLWWMCPLLELLLVAVRIEEF